MGKRYNYKEWAMCGKKRSFTTQRAANKAAERIFRTRDGGRSYECPHCFCWHITKKPRV